MYHPVSHRITIANAGHPPPVLLHLGGRAEVLRYTDGLVESRLRDVWTGIDHAWAAQSVAAPGP